MKTKRKKQSRAVSQTASPTDTLYPKKKRFQKTNEITLFPRGRININIYAYATRVEAVAELLAIRPETRVTYYFQVGGSCSVRL